MIKKSQNNKYRYKNNMRVLIFYIKLKLTKKKEKKYDKIILKPFFIWLLFRVNLYFT